MRSAASQRLGGWAVYRSLTLLRLFVVASAAILIAGGLVLSTVLTDALRRQALSDASASLTQYVDGVLGPRLVRRNRVQISHTIPDTLRRQLRRQPDLVSVKVWRADGVLAWTNRAPERIGHRFPLDGDLGEAIRENRAAASMAHPGRLEDKVERSLGLPKVLEVYAPLHTNSGKVIGAYEIYANPHHTESFIASRKHVVWAAVAAVFLLLYGALALLVRGGSQTLRRQASTLRARSKDLLESYRRLEESSLEAIASLNATVDAKDPYTAGHSARVQAIAISVAQELALPPERIDAVRFGGLFHDIGKIGVPDAILTKPAALTDEEYVVIQRHPADGADIVARFGRLREAVPLIRHHHERWDGAGYPDRLAGDAIPSEASIVGLADAWDAMTTNRPYHRALTLEEATAEVRDGRGTQFAPHVVDAFFAVLRRRPGLFDPEAPFDADIAVAG